MGKYKCIKNLVGYITVFLFFLLCFYVFHSYFFLAGMFVLCVFAIGDVIILDGAYRNISVKLKGKRIDCYKNVITKIGVLIENNSCFFSHNIFLKISMENEFYQEKSEHIINLPAVARKTEITEFPMEFLSLGKMKIKLEEIRVCSLLGIWERKRALDEELLFYIFPKEMGDVREVEKYEGIREHIEEKEEEGRKKGYDVAEMMGIREYIPGDRIRDIHWKLSGKKDELMVIERSNRSDIGETLLLELSDIRGSQGASGQEEKRFLDDVLVTCFRFVSDTVNQGTPIELTWWNEKRQEMQSYEVQTKDRIREMFAKVLESSGYQEENKLEQLWKKKSKGSYLWAGLENKNTKISHLITKGENGAIIKKEE